MQVMVWRTVNDVRDYLIAPEICSIFIPEGQVQVMGWRVVNDVRDHLIAPEYVFHLLIHIYTWRSGPGDGVEGG